MAFKMFLMAAVGVKGLQCFYVVVY